MAKLIYLAIMSLDGYIADEQGKFDWSEPDEQVHRFVNELARPIGTHLYGRRMYEVMTAWETFHTLPDQPEYSYDFARIWQAADKIVYSRTLEAVSTARTRLEREFDPDAIRQLKAGAAGDISVSGPDLAAHAIRAGLIDEWHVFISPVIVGGGNAFLPGQVRIKLELVEQRRFGNGVAYLRYRTAS